MELEQLVEAKAVQKAMRCSLAQVYRLAYKGIIPSVRIPQESAKGVERYTLRFRLRDIQEFIEKNYRRGRQ